jgi:hypothetical protein
MWAISADNKERAKSKVQTASSRQTVQATPELDDEPLEVAS